MQLGKQIEDEDGAGVAVNAFHKHLPSELPIPAAASYDEPPNPIQWLLQFFEKWCCFPCDP